MKNTGKLVAVLGLAVIGFASCKKNKCAECHYDDTANNTEVELGTKCGDEIEELEANGYNDGTNTYTVHCGEH